MQNHEKSSATILADLSIDSFPAEVRLVLSRLSDDGYEAYVVGGAVRDLLLGKSVHDWDFTTNAEPEQILALFPDGFYDNQFGTVGVAGKYLGAEPSDGEVDNALPDLSEQVFEITTFRSDGLYENHRHPVEVSWGTTLQQDLERRDFTINAMALDAKAALIDPFDGKTDLESKILRAVGDPAKRFTEDALRMLRAVRIASQLEFSLETETKKAIHEQADLITKISWERIRDEFLKLLTSHKPSEAITLLDEVGILTHILPELLEAKGVEQAHHHIYDVWTHSILAVEHCASTDPIVRFATLLHDIGKPRTADRSGKTVTFYNHEVVGSRMAKEIATRFRLSKKDIQRVFTLVRWHMFVYDTSVTDAYIRRFIKRVGVDQIPDMIALRVGDRIGSGAKPTSWRLEEMKQRIEEQLHQPFSLKDLKVNGVILMERLNLQPGPVLGKVLQALFDEVLEDPEKNTEEYLLGRAQELIPTLE